MNDRGATRITAMLEADRPALLPFMTAGIPDADTSVSIFEAMDAADGFEVGIPYADPLMDGPVIATAGRHAIDRGMNTRRAFQIVEAVVNNTGKPVIVMTYTNPILRSGIDDFLTEIAAAGASGLIVADLPVEEASPYLEGARRHGLGMALFVAPTTSAERLAEIAVQKPAFLYGVATLGVTGERDELAGTADSLAERVRSVTDLPLILGVGISTPAQAAAAGALADGVIVGSALVRTVMGAATAEEAAAAVRKQVDELAAALKS